MHKNPRQPETSPRFCPQYLHLESYDLHIHCAFGAADFLWKEFTKAGVNIPETEGPITRDYGIRDFTVIDPDGYAIVFGSPSDKGQEHTH